MKLLPIMSIHHLANWLCEYSNLSGRSCYLDLTPNSLTKLQGNVLNLEGRIMDQILAVKGLIKYPGVFLILTCLSIRPAPGASSVW